MNANEQVLVDEALETLTQIARDLTGDGYRPQVIVFSPEEIDRIPGYKVALVLPIESDFELPAAKPAEA